MLMAATRQPGMVDPEPPFYRRAWFEWSRFLLVCCSVFHVWMAGTLALAPQVQIFNAGTQPVFDLAPRYVWAAWFLVAAIGPLLLMGSASPARMFVTWLTVFPLGCAWEAAFVLAVIDGRGSAIGVVVWPCLYLPWAVVAVRLALGKR